MIDYEIGNTPERFAIIKPILPQTRITSFAL